MNDEVMYQTALSRQRRLIDEAAERRLLPRRSRVAAGSPLRSWMAWRLRGLADRLEPAPRRSQLVLAKGSTPPR